MLTREGLSLHGITSPLPGYRTHVKAEGCSQGTELTGLELNRVTFQQYICKLATLRNPRSAKRHGEPGVGGEGKGKWTATLPSETRLLRLCGNLTSQQTVQKRSKSFPSNSKLTWSRYAYLIQLQTLPFIYCLALPSNVGGGTGLAVNAALNKTCSLAFSTKPLWSSLPSLIALLSPAQFRVKLSFQFGNEHALAGGMESLWAVSQTRKVFLV